MELKPYPKYKDSGIQWIGEIPERWDVHKMKFLLKTPITDGPHETPEFIEEGIPFLSVDSIQDGEIVFENCRYISEEDHIKYKVKCNPRKNDVFMGKAASIGKIARVKVDFPFSIWSPLALLRVNNKIQSRFLEYSLKSDYSQDQIEIYATSNTQKNISMDDIPRIQLIIPNNILEQQKLTSFLNSKISEINQTIEKDKRLIELLKEKRTALINHIVTKGLNPNVKMKEVFLLTCDKAPEEWDIIRLKFVSRLSRGVDLSKEEFEEGEIPVYGSNGIIGYHSKFTTKGPSLTIGRSGSVGEINYVKEVNFWAHNTALYLQDNYGNNVKYLFYLFSTLDLKHLAEGSAVGTLNRNYIHNLLIALPPKKEQTQIVKHLDEETSKIDRRKDCSNGRI